MAVIEYIAASNGDKAKLLGQNAKETALVRQWLSWTTSELLVSIAAWSVLLRARRDLTRSGSLRDGA